MKERQIFKRCMKILLIFSLICISILNFNIMVQADESAVFKNCLIDSSNPEKIRADFSVGEVFSSDSKIYLYALDVYAASLEGYKPIAYVNYSGAGDYSITADLNYNTSASRLYSKFVLVVNQNGYFNTISDYHYITNPEVLAKNTSPKYVGATKKGISATVSDMKELNADNGLIEVTLQEFLTVPAGGRTVKHTYDGFTVYLNRGMVDYYDMVIGEMCESGISVNVGITGANTTAMPDLIYPGVDYSVETDNYGINTGNEIGLQYAAAVIDFMAERYSNPNGHGVVSNWLIGNEVNDEKTFYYIGANGIDDFVEKYMQTFRVAYNIIRSHYSNADVFMRMANLWYVVQDTDNFAGKKYLEKFNALGKKQGNFDWSVSYHPYSCPLTDADVLDDGKIIVRDYFCKYIGYAEHNFTTFEITMLNIDVLINFLKQDEFLCDNKLRAINLSEQGYISQTEEGEDQQTIQAASMIYAYYKALAMPEIESVFFYRYQDDADILEKYPHWKFGLKDVDGNKRYAHDIYKALNTSDSLKVSEFAKDIYGINSWSELIPEFDEALLSGFKEINKDNTLYSAANAAKKNILVSDMLNNWKGLSNIHWIRTNNVGEKWCSGTYNKRGWACTYDEGDSHEYAIVKHEFSKPLNLSSTPYLVLDFELDLDEYNSKQNIKQAEVIVRLTSNGNAYDASGVVEVGQLHQYFSKPYTLCVDVSGWKYKDNIDSIEIWVNQLASDDRMAAEIMVYDVRYAADVQNKTPLAKAGSEKTDISYMSFDYLQYVQCTGSDVRPSAAVKTKNGVYLEENKDYKVNYYNNQQSGTAKLIIYGIGDYTGCVVKEFTLVAPTPIYNGINYSAVFDADYYYNNNPDLAVEVGYDYDKLLEHFVNYGMTEGRWAKQDFNVLYYKYSLGNWDLREVYGSDLTQYYYHYMYSGQYEGRSVSDWDLVFDPAYYISTYPEIYQCIAAEHSEYSNVFGYALWHYYEYGMNEGRRGNSTFNVLNYEAANPDVWREYGSDYRQATIHFIQYGQGYSITAQTDISNYENTHPDVVAVYGHDPQAWIAWYDTYRDYIYKDIDYSAVYNPNDYREYNKDVAAQFGDDKQLLLWHFVNYGMKEGRCALKAFNAVKYMYGILNDDLRAAYGGDMSQYYYHYMNYGRAEGRSTSDYDEIFDADYYLQRYPDIKEAIINQYTQDGNLSGWALWHYCEYGINECRKPNKDFCILNYLAANPDVFLQYGDDYKAASIQYMQYGRAEGREIFAKTDISDLPKTRPDVVESFGINPSKWVEWYINYGFAEY